MLSKTAIRSFDRINFDIHNQEVALMGFMLLHSGRTRKTDAALPVEHPSSQSKAFPPISKASARRQASRRRHFRTPAGYHVLSAVDGAEALKLSRGYEGRIDLVLSDVKMPTDVFSA